MKDLRRIALFLTAILVFAGCAVDDGEPFVPSNIDLLMLPQDTGGQHISMPLGSTNAEYGYYVYEPGGYQESDLGYPLLIYLHGTKDIGHNDLRERNDLVLRNGVPAQIEAGNWNPSHPMLVVSPHLTELDWFPTNVHNFIAYLEETYRVNPQRIYITGISVGALGIYEYIRNIGSQSKLAAMVPIAGSGVSTLVENFTDIPIWAFHGEEDRVIPFTRSKDMINAINAIEPKRRARLTSYPGAGHDVWTMTYNSSGMGQENEDYDRFTQTIYDWMFKQKKD